MADKEFWQTLSKYKPYLPEETQSIISMYERIRPDLFSQTPSLEEVPSYFQDPKFWAHPPEGLEKPKTSFEQSTQQLANKAYQAEIMNVVPSGTAVKAMQQGYIPNYLNKNIGGIIAEQFKFPLKKLLSALTAMPRASEAAVASKAKEIMPKVISGEYSLADVAKQSIAKPKDALTWLKALVNRPGEYQDYTGAQMYKDIGEYAGVDKTKNKFFKQYEWTKDTNDWVRGTNWLQKAVAAVAGSPADITGVATDVFLAPETYLTGGIVKGAATGLRVTGELAKTPVGSILREGSEIALSKAGQKAFKEFAEAGGREIAEQAAKKLPNVLTKEGLETLTNKILRTNFIKSIPDTATATKYLDLGGLKFAGETLIPGYKVKTLGDFFKSKTTLQKAGGLVNEFANIPEQLKPFYQAVQSLGDAERNRLIEEFYHITKKGSNADFDKVQKYLWQMADIEKRQGKVRSLNTINKYKEGIKELNLNDKQLKMAEDLRQFWKGVSKSFTEKTGQVINEYDFYTPIRYLKEQGITKQSILGAQNQPFMKARNVSMRQAEKLGLKPKSLIESSTQRIFEQQRSIQRVQLLDQIKQFGMPFDEVTKKIPKGYSKLKNVPELKGWLIPDEYKNVIENSYNLFFGDAAFKNALKIYDKAQGIWKRWALATPGYHVRNFLSDTFSGLMEYGLDYLNPKYWNNMQKVLRGEHVPIKLGGVTRYADELKNEFTETGILGGATQYSVEGNLKRLMLGKYGKFEKGLSKVSIPEWSLKAGNIRENTGRVVGGLIEYDKGSNKIFAASNVKKVFFDYAHSLTPTEQNIAARVVPFYRWLKNNIRRQFELIFTRTGAYAAIPKTLNYLENVSETQLGGLEEYKQYRPEYFEDLGVTRTAITDYSGRPLAFNPNFPFQDWSRLNINDLFSSLSPFIKMPIELGLNKDIFFKTPIKNEEAGGMQEAPKFMNFLKILPDNILEKIGAARGANDKLFVSDYTMYAIRQIPMLYSLARMTPASEQVKTPTQMLSILGGIKFFPVEEEKFKEQKGKQRYGELKSYITQLEKQGEYVPSSIDLKSALNYIYDKYAKQQTGYDKIEELKETLKLVGSTKELDLLINLKSQPYEEMKEKAKGLSTIELAQLLKQLGIDITSQDIQNALAEKAGEQ